MRGTIYRAELAGVYEKTNANAVRVVEYQMEVPVISESREETMYEIHPETKALVVFSRPAIDSQEMVALVRIDAIPRDDPATTIFFELERGPNDE